MRSSAAYLFLVFFSFSINAAFSQKNDSILSAINLQKDDTSKVNALNAHARELILTADFISAIPIANKALELSEKLNFKKGKSISSTMLGVSYFGLGNYPEALRYHYMSLRIREELGDQKLIAATYHNIGNVYYSQGNVDEAMKNYQSSINIKRKLNDTLDSHYAHTLNNVANYYSGKNNKRRALELYNTSWQISLKLADLLGMLSIRNNMGNIYMNSGNYTEAEKIYLECLGIAEEMGDKASIAAIYISIGNLYLVQKKWNKAKALVTKGLEQAILVGSKDDIKNGYSYLWQINEGLGDYKKAYSDFVNYSNYRDSLDNEENTRSSTQTQMLYEFYKKEKLAKAEQEKKDLEYASHRKQQFMIMWASVSGLLLVIIFSFFLYNKFRIIQKQKITIEDQKLEVELQKDLAGQRMIFAEKQKAIIEKKQDEILDSIIYARRIQVSLLPSEKMIDKTLRRLKNKKHEK
ncbi:MAG: tetratricopeptide repeat protein [Bacteroidia bacterium]